MAQYDIPLETTPVDVAISYTEGLIAVLRGAGLDLINWLPGKPRSSKKPEITANVTSFGAQDNARQVVFSSSSRITVLLDSDGFCTLKHFDIDKQSFTVIEAGEDTLPLGTTRIISEALGAPDELYYVENYRNVISINNSSTTREFPTTCPWVEVARIDDKVHSFGLGENGKLYANNHLIASNCTSFIVTNAHLIYTTTQHLLKFVHLQTGGKGTNKRFLIKKMKKSLELTS